MNAGRRFCYVLLGVLFLRSSVHASVTPATPVSPTLTNLITGCSNIQGGSATATMSNYIVQHFLPAAQRFLVFCNMANGELITNQVKGADRGIILGIENNTSQTFHVVQNGGAHIGSLKRGMNDIPLHLASLLSSTSGAASHTSDITFVPHKGSRVAKIRLRVLSGLQLSTYVTNMTAQGTTLSINGSSASTITTSSPAIFNNHEQYLVLETVSNTSTPLPVYEQRVQVLNLSRINHVYTIMLEINTMGLVFEPKVTGSDATTVDAVLEDSSLNDVYLASIKNVHLLDELEANVLPLLILPRKIWQAGTSLNPLYATYVQSYVNFIAEKSAGIAPEYYDLMINYAVEPYAYLKSLYYFDTSKALLAVVDQSCNLSSGKVIGDMIGTNVYAVGLEMSSDLSLVQVAQDASGHNVLDQNYEHLMIGFDIASMKTKVVEPKNAANASFSGSTLGFPVNTISNSFFRALYNGLVGVNYVNADNDSVASALVAGDPLSVTQDQSYNSIGGFLSSFWSLSQAEWTEGIKLVPVSYDLSSFAPLMTMQDINAIASAKLATAYFYAFKAKSGEFIGAIPCVSGADLVQISLAFNKVQITTMSLCYQSPTYESYGIAKPGMTGLVKSPNIDIDYPGCFYLTFDYAKNIVTLMRNKMSDMSQIRSIVKKAWSLDYKDGSDRWMVSVPKAAMQVGVSVCVDRLAQNNYKVVVKDNNQNILGFKEFFTTKKVPNLQVCHVSSLGKKDWFSKPVKISQSSQVISVKKVGSSFSLTANSSTATTTPAVVTSAVATTAPAAVTPAVATTPATVNPALTA